MNKSLIISALLGFISAQQQVDLVTLGYKQDDRNFAPTDSNGCQSDTDLIKISEGFRSCTYKDSVGIKTICYGYNLERSCAPADIKSVGGDYDAVMAGGCLSQSQCDSLLNKEIVSARNGEKAIYGNKISCQCATSVLVDMTYNLGQAGLASFYTFNSLMEQG